MSLCVVKEQSQYNHQNRGHMQSGDPAEDRVTILAKHGKISSDDISRVSLYGRGPSSGAGHFVSDPNLIQIRGLRTILSITSKKQLPKYRPTPSTELRAQLIGHASMIKQDDRQTQPNSHAQFLYGSSKNLESNITFLKWQMMR